MKLKQTIQNKEKTCSGLFFKCVINNYYNKNKDIIEYRTSYRLLKRFSCNKGHNCESCDYFHFKDDMSMSDIIEIIEEPNNPVNGNIYKLDFVAGFTDFETGYLDDWGWKLTKINGS